MNYIEQLIKLLSFQKNSIIKSMGIQNAMFLNVGDKVLFLNGKTGTIIRYKSDNLGIRMDNYLTLCEPFENYEGLKHKFNNNYDIVKIINR